MFDLTGKIALITGAARGIGKGIALAFAERGADVIINYLDDDSEADETLSEIRAFGKRAEKFKADVTDRESVKKMFSFVMEEFGGLGADKFIKTTNKNIKGCINLDVCGIGDYIYCDNYNNDLFPKDCKFGKMPFCDGDIFKEYNIPVLTFSTSYKVMDFREGISEILKTIHNNERDNDIDIINFDLVETVSDKILESISLF